MKKWFLGLAFFVIIAVITFCSFYLFSSYSYLSSWYYNLNHCFYRQQYWQRDFFTPAVKRHGNWFCTIGLVISLPLLFFIKKKFKNKASWFTWSFLRVHFISILLCISACTLAWLWGYNLVEVGFDEVFSAVNCAALPPFQTLSYYMLPNNHILFNLVNSSVFYEWSDKVLTGKIISLVCYWGIIITVFYFLSVFIKNKLLLILSTILVCFQFPIWGFGFEARGYELNNLAGWITFIALINYLLSKEERWLYLYCAFCIIGYFTVPTFLCFHSAALLLIFLWMLRTRTFEKKLWYSQCYIFLFVYLLYLPAICFSGMHSLTGNKYIAAHTFTLQEFYNEGIKIFTDYLNYYSANFIVADNIGDLIIFLLPLTLLLFYKNRLNVLLGFFYLSMWIACIAIAYFMKVFPIDRAMGAQINISLALSIYVLYLLLLRLNRSIQQGIILNIGILLFIVALGIHFGIKNKERVSMWLYHNDINSKYKILNEQGTATIAAGSSVSFSDECFYWYYLCKKKGCIVNKCSFSDEQYYVRLNIDSLPLTSKRYTLYRTIGDYEIYQRK